MPLMVVAMALWSAAGKYSLVSDTRVRLPMNGIASGENFSPETTVGDDGGDGGVTAADLFGDADGVGEGAGGGVTATALPGGGTGNDGGAGDAAAVVGEGDGAGLSLWPP